jgi:hypothetical protein
MTDPFGRPPTWFLFHVDRESSGVLYARSRTIWCCRYVRAFGSRSRIERASRIGRYGAGEPASSDRDYWFGRDWRRSANWSTTTVAADMAAAVTVAHTNT